MKTTVLTVIVAFFSIAASAQTWTLDGAHSKLGFNISHLSISSVEGAFKTFDIKLTSSKPDFSDAVIELTADVNSIDTDNEKRDNHLKAPDYFDATKYPSLSFKGTSFKKVADKKYKLAGNLTLHGVTKPVELDVTLNGTAVHPYTKKTIAGFKVTGVVKRSEFGISPDTPSTMLGDEVEIVALTEFTN